VIDSYDPAMAGRSVSPVFVGRSDQLDVATSAAQHCEHDVSILRAAHDAHVAGAQRVANQPLRFHERVRGGGEAFDNRQRHEHARVVHALLRASHTRADQEDERRHETVTESDRKCSHLRLFCRGGNPVARVVPC